MRVYLKTFGCRANQADSETLRAMIEANGGSIVGSALEADVAVFNSCAVTAQAEADLRQSVRAAARRNPAVRSIVMGCAAALDTGPIAALPRVTHVIAASDFSAVAGALDLSTGTNTARRQSTTRALLRIQDGCDEHCTFCATRLARGRSRSVPIESLVERAIELSEFHAEIVLTGVHIGSYGLDSGSSLGVLVERLIAETQGVRFRLSSVEATEVDDRLVDLFAAPERLAPYLHAPLQSGSDAVLRRMGRTWYDARRYSVAVERILRNRGPFGLGADVIAGFPGETEADHQATMALVRELPFTTLHVFQYSARTGTSATRIPGAVSSHVISSRADELRELARSKQKAYEAARVGGAADVVALEAQRAGGRRGLTEDYLSVLLVSPERGRGERFPAVLAAGPDGLIAYAKEELAA